MPPRYPSPTGDGCANRIGANRDPALTPGRTLLTPSILDPEMWQKLPLGACLGLLLVAISVTSLCTSARTEPSSPTLEALQKSPEPTYKLYSEADSQPQSQIGSTPTPLNAMPTSEPPCAPRCLQPAITYGYLSPLVRTTNSGTQSAVKQGCFSRCHQWFKAKRAARGLKRLHRTARTYTPPNNL
jgi:hypothetical protein